MKGERDMLLISAIVFPAVAGVIASYVKAEYRKRCLYYAIIMILTDILGILSILKGGQWISPDFVQNVNFTFFLDGIGKYVLAAVLILYTAACFYAFEYMSVEERQPVFFGFYFVSLGAMIAVCMAGNLVTLYFSFEMATLSSMPLVLHEMDKAAIAAAMKYLFYSIAGALLGLLGTFFIYYYAADPTGTFKMGGFLDMSALAGNESLFLLIIFLTIIGFGTKAGMYPMHGWLPSAHPIAPAPASSLLSGIIAKAGVLAIIRVIYYSVGADFIRGTWVQYVWMSICMLTIFMGSMMAFRESVLKKRLAYSTISQISYILLGLSILSESGLEGALLHLMSHVASKGCLFLAAGVFIYKLHKRNVKDLKGVGKQMPITMWCFTIASLSLVGIPPLGGFLSKWVIAGAAIESGTGVFAFLPPVILLISALLTAGYLLPVVVDAFFPGADFVPDGTAKAEPTALMTIPMIVLCITALGVGLFGAQIVGMLGL